MDSQGRPTSPDQPNQPSKKHMLEENIRASRKWADALYRGTFIGKDALAIAALSGFLEDQYVKSVAEYEAESMKHPEWGRPKDLELAGGRA